MNVMGSNYGLVIPMYYVYSKKGKTNDSMLEAISITEI